MSATPSAPQGFEPPRAQLPEMGECGLLGVAALRVDIALDAAPAEAPIAMPTAALDLLAMYAPFVSAISRSQLQVFLI
jgi:hypothetical protein